MKIRTRITLWITGAGIAASLLFSVVVFYEMMEQPYEVLDAELQNQARLLNSLLDGPITADSFARKPMLSALGEIYWFKIYDEQQIPIYSSTKSSLVALPVRETRRNYTVVTRLKNGLKKKFNIDEDDSGDVSFRVFILPITKGGKIYTLQIAKSMGNLKEEITDLILALAFGLISSFITLLLAGYYVAGRILQPVNTINSLVHEINEKTISRRIPLGETRDELHQLSANLNAMFDRLQHSFEQQREFIANASHELKTPITMLRLFFDENSRTDVSPDEFRNKILVHRETLSRMDKLVKNLLDLSRLELKNTLEPTNYDLISQIDSVLTDFSEIFEIEHIRVETEMPPSIPVYADREKMRRMFINIIDNAIRYNRENGDIKITVDEGDTDIAVRLYNTGIGVPEKELDKIFDQFHRVEKSRSSSRGGSGLGLSIVEKIIKLHGGTISMQSKEGAWAQINISLPRHV